MDVGNRDRVAESSCYGSVTHELGYVLGSQCKMAINDDATKDALHSPLKPSTGATR